MKLLSLLSLNGADRAFGNFHIGVPVQRYPDGKPPKPVASNYLNAGLLSRSQAIV